MRRFWSVVMLVSALLAGPLRADDASDIHAVISDQISAFAADDLPTAYSFASPTIRSIYPSPEIFGAMVKGGYPMIWRPEEVSYFGLRSEDGRQVQRMGFRDAAGQEHLFDYFMVASPSGWKIDGVIPVRGGGEAV